jgi:hypothetical protein
MPSSEPQRQEANDTENLQGQITYATRAPNAKDKGLLWVYQTASSAVLYCRSKISGNWYAQA